MRKPEFCSIVVLIIINGNNNSSGNRAVEVGVITANKIKKEPEARCCVFAIKYFIAMP